MCVGRRRPVGRVMAGSGILRRGVGVLGRRADRGVNGGRGRKGVTVETGRRVGASSDRSLGRERGALRPAGREVGALEIRVGRSVNGGRGRKGVTVETGRRVGASSDRSLGRERGVLRTVGRDVNLGRGRRGVKVGMRREGLSSGRSLGLATVGRGTRMLRGELSLGHVEIGSRQKRDVPVAMRSRSPHEAKPRVGCAAEMYRCE